MRNSLFVAMWIVGSLAGANADTVNGSFKVYMAGKPVATETYSIQQTDGKVELKGTGKADLGVLKIDIQKFTVVTDAKFQPVSVEAKAVMGKMKMEDSITFGEGKAKNQMDTGQGPQLKEDDVHADALIVNANLPLFAWSPLALRVKLDSTEPQEFHAYIVGQAEVPVTVVSKGHEPVEFADRTVNLNHFAMTFPPGPTAPPMNVDVWLTDDRQIVKISVPAQNLEAYQSGYERKAPPPAVTPEPPK